MRAFVLGLTALAIGCSPKPQAERPEAPEASEAPEAPEAIDAEVEVGRYAKVYRGDEGLEVTIVPVTSGDAEQALIEVSGVINELDGLVLLYDIVPQGRDRTSYRTTLRGDDFYTVWQVRRGGASHLEIYLPGAGRDGRQAHYDEEASGEAAPEDLAARYAELARDGTIARLQKFNRAEREAQHDESFAESMARSFEDCGKEVPVTIDWSAVTDEHLKEHSISGYCDSIGSGIEALCRFPQGRRAFQEQVEAIECTLGDAFSVELGEGGALTWVAHLEGVNADQAARDLARTEFERDRVVLATEAGVYLTFDPGDGEEPIHFSDDGEAFYEQRETANSASGYHRWLFAAGTRAELSFEEDDDAWTLACGDRTVHPRELPREKAREVLEGATLGEHKWKREPFALARDDRGRYYYVDRLLERYGGKGFRVFTGLKGGLELTQLVDIVDDSQGTVFATESGDLRLIIDRDGAAGGAIWIRGPRRKDLIVLPLGRNQELIYRELGVYRGESLGSVCEVI